MAQHKVISLAELKQKQHYTVWIDKEEVLAVMTAEGVKVYSAMCPHQGGPLGEGKFKDDQVTCPWHGCLFELAHGVCTDMGACRNVSGMKLKPLAFSVDASDVYVELP